jgi:hypothetical protein
VGFVKEGEKKERKGTKGQGHKANDVDRQASSATIWTSLNLRPLSTISSGDHPDAYVSFV